MNIKKAILIYATVVLSVNADKSTYELPENAEMLTKYFRYEFVNSYSLYDMFEGKQHATAEGLIGLGSLGKFNRMIVVSYGYANFGELSLLYDQQNYDVLVGIPDKMFLVRYGNLFDAWPFQTTIQPVALIDANLFHYYFAWESEKLYSNYFDVNIGGGLKAGKGKHWGIIGTVSFIRTRRLTTNSDIYDTGIEKNGVHYSFAAAGRISKIVIDGIIQLSFGDHYLTILDGGGPDEFFAAPRLANTYTHRTVNQCYTLRFNKYFLSIGFGKKTFELGSESMFTREFIMDIGMTIGRNTFSPGIWTKKSSVDDRNIALTGNMGLSSEQLNRG